MDLQTIEKGFERVWQMFQETDRKFQESADQLKRLEALFGSRWGRFMEVLIDSGAVTALRKYGLDIDHSASNVKEQRPNSLGRGMEIDVLCWGKQIIVPIEVKTHLKVDDVRSHEERIERFTDCFPKFSDLKLFGAVAGLSFDEGSDRFAYQRGFYVLTLIGDKVVAVINDNKFIPKQW